MLIPKGLVVLNHETPLLYAVYVDSGVNSLYIFAQK